MDDKGIECFFKKRRSRKILAFQVRPDAGGKISNVLLFVLCHISFLNWIHVQLYFDSGESFDKNPEHNEIIFEEARISRVAEARFLLKFPRQLNGCCWLTCFFFVLILNDSILNFALLFERTLSPAHVTTLSRDVTREQPLPSFHPILHLYLYLCCLTRADLIA